MFQRTVGLTLVLLLGVACAPAYKKLPTLDEVPEMAALSRQGTERLRQRWELAAGEVEGRPYHIVADELGADNEDPLIVLVHGMVSDRTTWQFVSGVLGDEYRLFIPDLIGHGESDAPAPAAIGELAYSPTGSARHLLRALQERHRQQPLPSRVVFIGHSLGGGVVLRLLSNPEFRTEFPEIFSRVDRAILVAPLEFAVHRASETLAELTSIGSFYAFLGRATGVLRNQTAKELLASAESPEWVFKFDVDRVYDAFHPKARRLPTQAIIRNAVPFNAETGRPDWPAIDALVADYRNVDLPVLLIWGDRDETLPLSMGYKLQAELPDARLRILREGKHSLQADRPHQLSEWISRFVEDAGAGWAPIESIDAPSSN